MHQRAPLLPESGVIVCTRKLPLLDSGVIVCTRKLPLLDSGVIVCTRKLPLLDSGVILCTRELPLPESGVIVCIVDNQVPVNRCNNCGEIPISVECCNATLRNGCALLHSPATLVVFSQDTNSKFTKDLLNLSFTNKWDHIMNSCSTIALQ